MTEPSLREDAQRLLGAGDFSAALEALENLLRAHPDDPLLNLQAGNALLALGDAEGALDYYHLALHYDPKNGAALRGRVQALERLGRRERVEPAYREFLQRNPDDPEALLGLATALRGRGQFEEAVDALELLLRSRPDESRALSLLGLIKAREFGLLEEGEALVRRALATAPGLDAARSNLGWILVLQRRYPEGLAYLDEVLRRDPQDHETRLMRAHANLRRGEFAKGWEDIEARHHSRLAVERAFRFPRWHGEQLPGKTLLVYAEQGLGDQIMYTSCLADAMARVGRVVLECEPRLVTLFRRSFPPAVVKAQAADLSEAGWLSEIGPVDFQIPMGSLPPLFRLQWSDFPRHRGYLSADPARVAAWRERLNGISPLPKIGISWRGGTSNTRRGLRSIGLESWGPLLGLPARFFSLQYGEVEADLNQARETSGATVMRFPEAEVDYDELAALVAALDLVITVCTAVVHLAGALGRETWVLTPAIPESRYLDHGESMPWYPSVRLIRQKHIGSWEPLIARVAAMLASRIAEPGKGSN
jgi:tetratricopeptide (TPR) repeat protein